MITVIFRSEKYPGSSPTQYWLELSTQVGVGPATVIPFVGKLEAEQLVADIQDLLKEWPNE